MARNPETDISNQILAALSGDDCLCWKQTVGVFRGYDNPNRVVTVGVPGLSDIMTVRKLTITPEMVGKTIAVPVAHETKTGKGKQRESQEKWERAFVSRGGIYLISRSPEQALQQVADLPGLICRK